MENAEIVPVAALRVKLTQLNGELRKINERKDEITEEVKHIEYFIRNFGNKKTEMPVVAVKEKEIPSKGNEPFDRRLAIESVLKDSGLVMSSGDIRAELERRGTPIPQDSFNSITSVESRKEGSHVERVGYGKFRYRKEGDKGTPSSFASLAGAAPSGESAASISREQ